MLTSSSSTASSSSSSSSSSSTSNSSSAAQPHHNINLKIQNVVASCRVTEPNVTVDLKKLVLKARNAEFQPKRFSAVIMRLREPKSTALIFKSGKMVVLGAKEENQSKIAARKYAKIISLCDVADKVTFKDFRVSNMVAVADCQFPIRLEGLALSHIKFSSYEPELFPGLIYRLENPKLVLLIFVSGKVVLTGAKSKHNLRAGFDKMYYILHEHRKLHLTTSLPPQPQQVPAHLPPSSSSSSSSSSVHSSTAAAAAVAAEPTMVAGTAMC